ncbi:MAG: tetratricopeptide repeat protein [Candidatus Cloacimonetes bacterium]|nr:tetratricopeptide repeat protein [Candidatus Cloacimonadota bacterium]
MSENEALDKARTHYNRGVEHYDVNNYAEAVYEWEQAISCDSSYLPAHFNLGVVYGKMGKEKEEDAIRCYLKVIELDSKHFGAHFNLGVKYGGSGREKQAVEHLTKAIEIDPNHASAYSHRGRYGLSVLTYDEQIRDFKRAIELNPNFGMAYLSMADAELNEAQINPIGVLRKWVLLHNAIKFADKGTELMHPSQLSMSMLVYIPIGHELCNLAMEIFNFVKDSDKNFNMVSIKLGAMTGEPSMTKNHKNIYQKAVYCFNKALEISRKDSVSAEYLRGLSGKPLVQIISETQQILDSIQ